MVGVKPSATAELKSPLPPPLQQAIASLRNHLTTSLQNVLPKLIARNPSDLNVSSNNKVPHGMGRVYNSFLVPRNCAMSDEDIEERLYGVPVFAISNASREFVLVSGTKSEKSLGLFCFSEADAETLLNKMRSADPSMSLDSQVVPVSLSKVFQLKVDGVAPRLLPEASQIRNALKITRQAGVPGETFPGVPVFQSHSLLLSSQDKRYRPVFFRKEDLENSLSRAARDQNQINPALRGDVQVAVLEDVIRGMKDDSVSLWDDAIFIPPGFDVEISTDPSRQS